MRVFYFEEVLWVDVEVVTLFLFSSVICVCAGGDISDYGVSVDCDSSQDYNGSDNNRGGFFHLKVIVCDGLDSRFILSRAVTTNFSPF